MNAVSEVRHYLADHTAKRYHDPEYAALCKHTLELAARLDAAHARTSGEVLRAYTDAHDVQIECRAVEVAPAIHAAVTAAYRATRDV